MPLLRSAVSKIILAHLPSRTVRGISKRIKKQRDMLGSLSIVASLSFDKQFGLVSRLDRNGIVSIGHYQTVNAGTFDEKENQVR